MSSLYLKITPFFNSVNQQLSRLLPTPLRVAIFVAVLLLCFVGARLAVGGFDFSRFIVIGEYFANQSEMTVPLKVLPGHGYDGQMFFRLALDPWKPGHRIEGIRLDSAAYRQQRILYPAMVWVLSGFGKVAWVPFIMVLVNGLALVFVAWIFSMMAAQASLPLWLGVLPAVSNGLLLSLGRDTAEPVAALCLVAAIFLVINKKHWAGNLALALGVLTRETMIIPSIMHVLSKIRGSFEWKSVWGLSLPIIVLIAWQFYLRSYWGTFPWEGGTGNLGFPLVSLVTSCWGQINEFLLAQSPRIYLNAFNLLHLFWMLWLTKLVFPPALRYLTSRKQRIDDTDGLFIALSWIAWLGLISLFTSLIWVECWSFARVTAEWSTLGWALLFHKRIFPGYPFIVYTVMVMTGDMFVMVLFL
jgi:hypothetical protein